MELTALRLLLAAIPVVALFFTGVPAVSDAQRIVSFPSAAKYETSRRDRAQEEFPRREELLQALDFLEEYERGKENDWNAQLDIDGALNADTEGFSLENNDVYPFDFGLDRDDVRQGIERFQENTLEDNTVDIPPWLTDYLLQQGQTQTRWYPVEEEEDGQDLLADIDDETLLQIALEEAEDEAAERDAYMEEVQREEEEAIADIVEEEMEDMAVENILDDLWAEEVLQEDAEDQLKWLLIEEEDRMRRQEEEEEGEEEEEEDPFQFEYLYSDEDIPLSSAPAEGDGESFLEGMSEELGSDYGAEYLMSSSVEDYVGESLDEEEKEELMEEAAEILQLQDREDEEEERNKELRANSILKSLIGSLTREAIEEEMEEANAEDGYLDEEGEVQSSSVLDAGMGDEEPDEEAEKEVYDKLIEFLADEIDRAIEDVAGDVLQAVKMEGQKEGIPEQNYKTGQSSDEGDYGAGDYDSLAEEEGEEVTSEGSEVESDIGDICPSLQYFIDDCNIVNNYADLGADGYKKLFSRACNRHQLCYACGEYYDVGTKLCDELYKAEMLARCEVDDTDCKQRAKYFWLVARNNRIPDLESSPVCGDPCILNFLMEV